MMMAEGNPGILFVLSAPSGTGKSTVARALVSQLRELEFSVSYTTRPPRPGEEEGRDYNFIGRERFESMIADGDFLEWATVFGNLYGTGLERTRRALRNGRDLLLDIDIQGARKVRSGPLESVSVMILPPDYATLEKRLAGRGSEEEPERRMRLTEALVEAGEYKDFDYVVVNDELDRTVSAIEAIVRAERRRSSRCEKQADNILATFKI
jgi:guanylate kinase